MGEDDITLASIHKLEYLDAVITETLRVYPPVAIPLPRCVPSGGETISGSFVPEGTTIGVHHYSTYHSPSNFHLAEEFHPERWLRESRDLPPFVGDNKECMQPFSYGPRECLGKNIARAEMRLLLAKLIWRFDLELEGWREGWMTGQKVQGFWQKGRLICRLSPVVRRNTRR